MYLLNLGKPKYADHSEAFPKGKINQERAKQPERYMFTITPGQFLNNQKQKYRSIFVFNYLITIQVESPIYSPKRTIGKPCNRDHLPNSRIADVRDFC